MQKNTFRFIVSAVLCLSIIHVHAQKKNIATPVDTVKTDMKIFNGVTIYTDLASPIVSLMGNTGYFSYTGGVQVDLNRKYYPVLELGIGGADKTTNNKINYHTTAPFGKIGIDFNLLTRGKTSKPTNNLFLAGVRLGMTRFSYNVSNIHISNNYWGGSETINYTDEPAVTKTWWEITAGVRVEIIKNIFMGWNVRTSSQIKQDTPGSISPWYIPGFGLNSSSNWGFSYTLGYHF